MSKAIIRFGYDNYVMESEDAMRIYEILGKAEHYHNKYQRKEDGGTMHYVWQQDMSDDLKSIQLMPDSMYRMAKLAGKPEDK